MKSEKIRFVVQALIIAAAYIILTFISSMIGLSSGVMYIRLSEALAILPVFTPAAIPGLFIGCLASNYLTGCIPLDIVIGSLATLISALCTYRIGRHSCLSVMPTIVINSVTIGCMLKYAYGFKDSLIYYITTVGTGEIICCGAFGMILMFIIEKYCEK